ncbi:hypothetical protein GCM10009864_41330 [Streptomyces lunalinharesii]|uniref:Uncharacterized protein n=1 Tax=Streptomyces lunalinharesii TaxID=333384 RepID=A0ABP6EI37_9ACTN
MPPTFLMDQHGRVTSLHRHPIGPVPLAGQDAPGMDAIHAQRPSTPPKGAACPNGSGLWS